ncbi:ABATE domain-containing protein [Paenibacillus sp. JTLBN-2024]
MLWDDFVNSHWHDWRGSGRKEDRLEKETWLRRFMQENGITAASLPDPAELRELKKLRAFLRELIGRIVAGENMTDDQIGMLNDWMEKAPVYRKLTRAADEAVSSSVSSGQRRLDAKHGRNSGLLCVRAGEWRNVQNPHLRQPGLPLGVL